MNSSSFTPAELADFIARARAVYGGEQQIRAVRTIAQLERIDDSPPSFRTDWKRTYRKAGGFVRIESFGQQEIVTTLLLFGDRAYEISGQPGEMRPADLLPPLDLTGFSSRPLESWRMKAMFREVRLSPRNFLAHADEVNLSAEVLISDGSAPSVRMSAPSLAATALFDLHTTHCLAIEDLGLRITRRFSDYREVDGLLTPFRIEEWSEDSLLRTLSTVAVRYNLELDDSVFSAIRETREPA